MSDAAEASGLSILNAVGIVAAGGLGGLWYLTKTEKESEASAYEEKISTEKAAVERLTDETKAKQEAMEELDRVMESLQEASKKKEQASRRQIELEREVSRGAQLLGEVVCVYCFGGTCFASEWRGN